MLSRLTTNLCKNSYKLIFGSNLSLYQLDKKQKNTSSTSRREFEDYLASLGLFSFFGGLFSFGFTLRRKKVTNVHKRPQSTK
jgi:hypothetical protein